MREVAVNLKGKEYKIIIQKGITENCSEILAEYANGKKVFVITDSIVATYYRKRITGAEIIVVPAGEGSKSIATLEFVYNELLSRGISREDTIVALGGGVVGDLSGFVASTILRGVNYIQIPTTLLAQVDSSVGGKTAINLNAGKNLVGTFYQPKLVIIDSETLKTLPKREISCGMAEVIKYGCIRDKDLFEKLEANYTIDPIIDEVIETCCRIKAEIVEKDEFDTGERMLLNFGHTLGHGIEKKYGFGQWSHGAAVAVGMNIMARYGEAEGFTKQGTAERILKLCKKFTLPTSSDLNGVAAAIMYDKKVLGGDIRIVLLNEIGSSFYKKVPLEVIKDIIVKGGA